MVVGIIKDGTDSDVQVLVSEVIHVCKKKASSSASVKLGMLSLVRVYASGRLIAAIMSGTP